MTVKNIPSTFSVFRNRSFTLLWIGQLVSSMGSALTALAASILVYRVTGSALSVGLMLTRQQDHRLRLIAGVFVDRYDQTHHTTQICFAVFIFLIPFRSININCCIYRRPDVPHPIFDSAMRAFAEFASEKELSAATSMWRCLRSALQLLALPSQDSSLQVRISNGRFISTDFLSLYRLC